MARGLLGRRGATWVVVALMLLGAAAAWGQAASLGPDDWQYRELDALGQAGLLSGHPRGPIGEWTGGRLSRYEAAALTLRAVQGIAQAYQEQGAALHQMAKAESAEEPATPAPVTHLDLARVEKLISEFRAELVKMGVRADDLESAMQDVQTRLAKVEAEQRKHKIDGYAQVRYEADSAPDGRTQFMVRRTRVNLRGPVSDRWSYRVEYQLDAKESGKARGSKVQLRTLYADRKLSNGRLRLGQAKIPWGYELLESVPALWTSERAFFMDRLFPNQRDIGVQAFFRKSPDSPQLDVGVFNGTGINANDNNDRKNVMARINVPVPNGSIALSGYVGENDEGVAATDQNRFGVSSRFKWPGGTEFMGEAVSGEDRGANVRGWYAQIGHPLCKKRPDLLFAKYDQYDENRDVADDVFRRWSLGYWWEPEPPIRLGVVCEIRNPDEGFSEFSKWDDTRAWMQLQIKY